MSEPTRKGAVHWLVRIAERAGFADRERPELAAGADASEAWTEVTRTYELSDADLARMVIRHRAEVIDAIIMATIIPDQPVPSMASALARRLGIPRALAFDLNAACSGWLYALEIGRSLILSGTARNVLVVTAELLSRITNPTDHEARVLWTGKLKVLNKDNKNHLSHLTNSS